MRIGTVVLLVALLLSSAAFAGGKHAPAQAKSLEDLPGSNTVAGQEDPAAVIVEGEKLGEIEGVDLDFNDVPGANSVAGQQYPGAVVKEEGHPLFEARFYMGARPAIASCDGVVKVTAGKSYGLDIFWVDENGKIVAKPEWARTVIVGTPGVVVSPDGSFRTKVGGFVFIQWWRADRPHMRWMTSAQVNVKHQGGGTHNLDDI